MSLPRWVLAAWVAALLASAAGSTGCSRKFYRRQADEQANRLIDQKATLVGAPPEALRIGIDPRSRMYSAENPDRPAMPPDDPVAHAFLECVDGKRGARANRFAERTAFVENPDWFNHVPRNAEGKLSLDLAAAVDVALLHSPDYQGELEELYLSALDVSFERFRFDAQFFGGSSVFYTADGRDRSGTGGSSSELAVSPSRSGNRFRIERLTATGGEIVAGFANSLVWQFAGPNDYSGNTLLDFTLIQPLLRTGGRTLVLERLTIAERALLSNVRIMQRFRRGFWLNIATGIDAGPGPSRRGGFFGGSGLDGFTGVGGGGFGRVGGTGGGGGGGAGAAAAGGYFGLLQQTQELRNERANVAALRASVDQLQASFDAGRIDRFQVDLARQALFDGQSRLLAAQANLESSTDGFLVDLGLPPDVPVELSDPLLDPFQLRSPELTGLQERLASLGVELRAAQLESQEAREGALSKEIDDGEDGGESVTGETPPEVIPPGPVLDPAPAANTGAGKDADDAANGAGPARRWFEELSSQAREELGKVEQDFAALLAAAPKRREHLALLAKREEIDRVQVDRTIFEPATFDRRVEQIRGELDRVGARVLAIVDAPTPAELSKPCEALAAALLELSLLQARARLDTIDIEPTELTDTQALAIANLYRRDIKNARTALVDSWRLINFNANDLLSDLDLTFSGDLGNVGDNPLRLRDTNGRLRVGIEFDGPLTRLGERNLYRQSLIEYQQARRTYYQFVDQIYQGLRATLRQIRLNEINLELRRQAVLIAITQVDLTQLRLSEPPKPGVEQQLSSTTARDLVEALADLLSVQNDFLSVWVNNRVQRLSLEFNLGLMQLDPAGQRLAMAAPFAAFVDAVPVCDGGSGDGGGPVDGLEPLPADVQPILVRPGCEPAQLPNGNVGVPIEVPASSPGESTPLSLPQEVLAPVITPLDTAASLRQPAAYAILPQGDGSKPRRLPPP